MASTDQKQNQRWEQVGNTRRPQRCRSFMEGGDRLTTVQKLVLAWGQPGPTEEKCRPTLDQHQLTKHQHQPSQIHHQPSQIHHQPSEIHHQPSQKHHPPSHEKNPPSQEHHPSSQEHHPSSQKHHPASQKHHQSSQEHHQPSQKHHQSSQIHHQRSQEHHQPSQEHHQSSQEHHQPSQEHGQLSAHSRFGGHTSTEGLCQEQRHTQDGNTWSLQRSRSLRVERDKPTAVQNQVAVWEQLGQSQQEQERVDSTLSGDKSTEERRKVLAWGQPGPTEEKCRPTQNQHRLTKHQHQPSQKHHQPSQKLHPPSQIHHQPSHEKNPPSQEHHPSSKKHHQPSHEKNPPSQEHHPPSQEHHPSSQKHHQYSQEHYGQLSPHSRFGEDTSTEELYQVPKPKHHRPTQQHDQDCGVFRQLVGGTVMDVQSHVLARKHPGPIKEKPRPTQNQHPPTQEKPRPTQNQNPPIKEKPRPTQNQNPPIKEKPRSTQNQHPPTQEKPRSTQNQNPPTQEKSRPTQNQNPPIKEKPRPTQNQNSPIKEKPRSTQNQHPPTQEKPRSTQNQNPPIKEKPRPTQNRHPPTQEKPRSTQNQNPPIKEKPRPTQNQHPPTQEKPRSTQNQNPPIKEKPRPTQNQHPPTKEQSRPTQDQHPPTQEMPRPTQNQHPSTKEKPRSTQNQNPPTQEKPRPTQNQHPPLKEQPRPTQFRDLFQRLGLEDRYKDKLTRTNFLEISPSSVHNEEPSNEKQLIHTFMQRLLTVDYKSRHITVNAKPTIPKSEHTGGKVYNALLKKRTVNTERKQDPIHPMDVQMAVFLCADPFLQQTIVTKLSQCQYALPLLVPSPFTGKIEFPLWTMRQINKSWKRTDTSGQVSSKLQPMCTAETPMVAFFRLGSLSSSKSQLMNSLINEKHNTFFHRHCPGSSRTRLLMDGVVEIAWYLPSGKSTDHFPDCVAFCNLHGDSSNYVTQRKIVTEMASMNVVFLPKPDENDNNMEFVKQLCKSSKPLIVLFTDEEEDNEDAVYNLAENKFRVVLRGRNQSDVSDDLRRVIKFCLSKTSKTFRLENMEEFSELNLDELNLDCQRGKEAAQNMMEFLERKDPSTVKETYLPYQGQLWHAWCQKNKDLRRLQTNNTEMQKSRIHHELREIRRKQRAHDISDLIRVFVESLESLSPNEKMYFLKWSSILFYEFTSDKLCDIHQEYDSKWTQVLALKKKNDDFENPEVEQSNGKSSINFFLKHEKTDQLKTEWSNLEKLSKKLNAANFGLEHMLREIGQIYEASLSEKKGLAKKDIEVFSHLPRLVAELILTGFPLELMDGDAGHVPLVWVSAVLDELIKILGDQRVFVLSVLGIQSSGKSTMLNAMFGLQFAVSAGRCTRGAFMQLVKVSEEMKAELKFDYILVVDTEGLRALELAGKSTRNHDNELATFVVGLGNMTLINIFGENPAEMQDILQIVVHAFLRMKKVRLNPSCVFVHQNVSDVAAREKIMEGRRRLQQTLDERTKLAAKEEVYEAECFGDVITFNVQKDVKYFAQLWEGNPPMAPPNPSYSRNVRELKQNIISYASQTNTIKLSRLQNRVKHLWNALLNENFVFSFKNVQEISVYRKLEEQYESWTWSLRSAMLSTEDKMFNRVASGTLENIDKLQLIKEMADTMENIHKEFQLYFEEDNDKETLIQWKCKFEKQIENLHEELINDAKRKLDNTIKHKIIKNKLDQKLAEYENTLFEKSKELALGFKENGKKCVQKEEFELMWQKWISELTKHALNMEDVDIPTDMINILGEIYERSIVTMRRNSSEYKNILIVGDYNKYVSLKTNVVNQKCLKQEDQQLIRDLILKISEQTKQKVNSFTFSAQGYNSGYMQDIARDVRRKVQDSQHKSFAFKREFGIDLSLYVCEDAIGFFTECHRKFKESNDPFFYLKNKQNEYFRVFEKFLHGATSAAILGDQICSKLKEAIKSSVYNMMAKYVCGQMTGRPPFNGNRADLEKYILKSLAEQKGNKNEKFKNFLTYMYKPRVHFENFIKIRVEEYMRTENPLAVSAIKQYLEEKQKNVISSAKMTTDRMKAVSGDTNMWLEMFSNSLVDELGDTRVHLSGREFKDVVDFELLVEFTERELRNVVGELEHSLSKLSSFRMDTFRERPDEILIKHFCKCCWEQCPFCRAVCTNSQKDHAGDHNADFHRSSGINGVNHKGTTEFCIDFCTTLVASDTLFWPPGNPERSFPYKQYREAGGQFARWGISTDFSELAYWKWFICEFQENLENYHNTNFCGKGKIPEEWKNYNQQFAVASLGLC
ncbi:interferon-induced very large GTPase 1-like [Brachyhypopomus gauderio]|uniref:interferon-induced very large GTPase 1-like n=1 Tax=Brachyhypopomus gauderio TaxID=698409 RepID=UPI0040421B32